MKKLILISLAVLGLMVAATSCSTKTVEEQALEWAEKLAKARESKNEFQILKVAGQCMQWYEKLSKEDQEKLDNSGLKIPVEEAVEEAYDLEDARNDVEGALESLFEE